MGAWVVPLGRAALVFLLCTLAVGFSIRPIRRRWPKFNITLVHRILAILTTLFALMHVGFQQF